jgi:hypothetical protein
MSIRMVVGLWARSPGRAVVRAELGAHRRTGPEPQIAAEPVRGPRDP